MKLIMSLFILLVLSGCAETTVYLGARSHHWNSGEYNENNHFVAVEYKSYIAGTFINSYAKRSHMAGYNFSLYENDYIILQTMAVGVVGYESVQIDNYPMVGKVALTLVPVIQLNAPYIRPAIGQLGQATFITIVIPF